MKRKVGYDLEVIAEKSGCIRINDEFESILVDVKELDELIATLEEVKREISETPEYAAAYPK